MPYPDYNGGPTGYYQPDPIVSHPPSGRSIESSKCSPFELSLINEGDADIPEYYIKVGAGTINNVLNTDWDQGLPVATSLIEDEESIYIFADVSFTNGQASSVSYSLDTGLPPLEQMDPSSKDGLPARILVLIGVWKGQSGCSTYSTSFTLEGYEAFRVYNSTGRVVYEPYYKLKVGT
jgi:hypothetical protein